MSRIDYTPCPQCGQPWHPTDGPCHTCRRTEVATPRCPTCQARLPDHLVGCHAEHVALRHLAAILDHEEASYQAVTPEALTAYLTRMGWLVGTIGQRSGWAVRCTAPDRRREVVIPTTAGRDPTLLRAALATIARVEDRVPLRVLCDVLHPPKESA